MKFFSPMSILATTFIAALLAGCGPGTPGDETDEPAPPAPEWAFGWWTSPHSPESNAQWGIFSAQMEIRPDGTVLQIVNYCKIEDWVYESRWELQPDGALRILPRDGENSLPFWRSWPEYQYVDVLPANESCQTTAIRIGAVNGTELPTTIERGRWCIGEYVPEFDECPVERYCGEPAPVCE
jgi:hypothetical protein